MLDHDSWDAWHPGELHKRLHGIAQPWCVVGGWALDLWHGTQTRDHEDIEFTVLRADLPVFRERLNGLALFTAGDGKLNPLADDEQPPQTIFQIWCQDVSAQRWRLDMMIEPGSPDIWVYKRDPAITRPRSEAVALSADGIPYLKPSAVLLFKAKYQRPKDEADFALALPRLEQAERVWLKDALMKLHPGHDWLAAL